MSTGHDLSIDKLLTHIADDLAERFVGVFAHETVERCIRESYQSLYRTSTIKKWVPLGAEKFARERLIALAQAKGAIAKTMPEVLFICVHNAGRSQMAAALLHRAALETVHVRSAGSLPAGHINAAVVEAMTEIGVDITHEFPKPLTDDVIQAADVVITMGCGDACPVYPGKRYLDWDLPDPDGQPLDVVRTIRDQIDDHVHSLLIDVLAKA